MKKHALEYWLLFVSSLRVSMLLPVLLCGGIGSRLWPLSRSEYPKPFLSLLEEPSLFQATISRLSALTEAEPAIVVAQEKHRFLVAEQLRLAGALDESTVILEPCGRNTAPALALAALHALQESTEDPMLLVLACDHWMGDNEAFARSVRHAMQHAEQGQFVTFGVEPTRPDTGYGYLEAGDTLDTLGAHALTRFIEKPALPQAEELVTSGNCYWNSGMFLLSAAQYLDALQTYAPDIYEAVCRAHRKRQQRFGFYCPDTDAFASSPADSIDYAVMEKCRQVAMVPLQTTWSDVGTWDQLADKSEKDANGNTVMGDVVSLESQDNYVHATHRLVTLVGVHDLVVVETPDAVLVSEKSQAAPLMKPLVEQLSTQTRPELETHRMVHRPWGSFETLDSDARYLVKRITVAVGGRLSLQMHHHRSEHWVVVRGSARVRRGDEAFLLTENQSTYIPIGVRHALENIGKIPLELIEVQSGSYLGEDDIVRFEDAYGRETEKVAEVADSSAE